MGGGDVEKMVLVGLVWGATNAFMKRGALIWDKKLKSPSQPNRPYQNPILKTMSNWINLVLTWQYSLPFMLNLSASATFFAILGNTPISLAVPVTNATTFAATAVFGMILGEKIRVGLALLGTFFIVVGLKICNYNYNALKALKRLPPKRCKGTVGCSGFWGRPLGGSTVSDWKAINKQDMDIVGYSHLHLFELRCLLRQTSALKLSLSAESDYRDKGILEFNPHCLAWDPMMNNKEHVIPGRSNLARRWCHGACSSVNLSPLFLSGLYRTGVKFGSSAQCHPDVPFFAPLSIRISPVGRSNMSPITLPDGISSFSHSESLANCLGSTFETLKASFVLPPQTRTSASTLSSVLSGVSFNGSIADIPEEG
ncbi:hypothetical protein Leryth_022481 [Lithospermum erythrorhizon]|nr:hypothetical protein Leryth_022481 [Lithospermum erythrorhizon]